MVFLKQNDLKKTLSLLLLNEMNNNSLIYQISSSDHSSPPVLSSAIIWGLNWDYPLWFVASLPWVVWVVSLFIYFLSWQYFADENRQLVLSNFLLSGFHRCVIEIWIQMYLQNVSAFQDTNSTLTVSFLHKCSHSIYTYLVSFWVKLLRCSEITRSKE